MTLAINVPLGEFFVIRGRAYERIPNSWGRSERYITRPCFRMLHAPFEEVQFFWNVVGELVGLSIPYDGPDR